MAESRLVAAGTSHTALTAMLSASAQVLGQAILHVIIGAGEVQGMTQEDNQEWLARRAVWREEWEYVSNYVTSLPALERLQAIQGSQQPSLHRGLLVLGVYTSYGIKFKDIEYLKQTWRPCVAYLLHEYPRIHEALQAYWDASIARFYTGVVQLSPSDFGLIDLADHSDRR